MRKKSLLRKIIYLILFIILGACFVLISEKYKENGEKETIYINDYYKDVNKERYEVIGGLEFIKMLDKGKYIIEIGSKNLDWSENYIEEVDKVVEELELKKVYHYDINNDKAQKNSTYYELINLLKGNLITTDGSEGNLLAPSLYIVEDGKVLYYNIETVATRNTDKPSKYWTKEKQAEFNKEIKDAITKYYLNNK